MFLWKYDIFSQSLLLFFFVAFFCIIMNSNKRWGILYHRQIYCCFIIFVIVASKTKNTKTPQYWPFVSEIFRPPLSLQMSWHLTRPLIHTMMTEELDMFSSHQGFRNALVDRIMLLKWPTKLWELSQCMPRFSMFVLGPISRKSLPLPIKFEGYLIFLGSKSCWIDLYAILCMPRQLCCRGICKTHVAI